MVVARSFAVHAETPLPEESMVRMRKTYVVIAFRVGFKLFDTAGALSVIGVQTP